MFANASELLPGLQPAAFRGVRFDVVDVSHEVGRRIVTHFFPGVDAQAREDQGEMRGPIAVAGFLIGDDYVGRARALDAALRAPGPGTLVHPWLGELRVVVPAGAKIKFSVSELRVMRFEATFEPEAGSLAGGVSTLSRLVSSLDLVRSAASGLVTAALAARGVPVLALSAATDVATAVVAAARSEAARTRNAGPLSDALDGLARDIARRPGATTLAAAGPRLSREIAAASRPRLRPAVAAGGAAPPARPEPIPARDGASLALRVAAAAERRRATLPADIAMRAAIHAAIVAASVETAAAIAFESREEAWRWRDDLDAGLDRAASLVAPLTLSLPGPASQLWTALRETRAALGADFNEIVGRLPRTAIVRAGGVPVLLLAYDLAGDAPASVFAQAAEITRRNRLANPAFTPADGVEVLR